MGPAEVMGRYLAAMQAGDREAAFAFYADDLVAHVPGRSALAGELRGRDAFVGYIQAVLARVEHADVDLVEMLVGEERVALLVRERLAGPDGEVEIGRANVYRVRDGRITEIWIYEADQYAVDDLLAATDDPFGAFERSGWSAGRAAPYHHAVGDITAQCVEALLDAAGVGPGVRVLDVATGPGYAAGRAAARGADAVGVDFSPEMVALAARLQRGVDVRVGDANALPFPDGSFGAVTANFLMPHVSDLPGVVRELARVARPGGRIALTTWDAEGAIYARGIPEAVAAAGASPPSELPPGPPFFQYADDEAFAALLGGAGLVDPRITRIEFDHRIGDLDAFWADLIGGTVRMNALVTSQDAGTQARIRAEYERLLEPYRRRDGWEVPCVVKLGSATKP